MAIDSTKGGSAAVSYASVVEADALLLTVYGADEWASLVEADKEKLLQTAAQQIDEIPLYYSSLAITQALNFPLDTTESDEDIGDGFTEAKKACIYQALYIFENSDTMKEAISGKIQGIKSEGFGSISKSVTGYNPFSKWQPKVMRLLSPFSDFSFKTYRY
jgi:hypothetical protein